MKRGKPGVRSSCMIEEQPHAELPHITELPQLAVNSNVQLPFFKRKWVLVLGIVLASLIVLILLLDNVIMPLYVKEGSVATVPNVVGAKKEGALQTLKTAGYEPVEYEVRFDDKAPDGTIIRQTPEGGEETKPGRKVYLIISGGKEMVSVADLRGKSLRDAKMLMIKSNMSIGKVNYAYSDSAANGMVFEQTPLPGTKTSASTEVSVTISQGPLLGRVPVPSLSNLSLSQAIEKLKSVNLELGKVNYQNGAPENAVLDQYPPAGDLVNEGATIDVFVARGGDAPPANTP
jgi:beta-lactam-binding protein with PASTA domain